MSSSAVLDGAATSGGTNPGSCGFCLTTADGYRVACAGGFRLHGTAECSASSVEFIRQATASKLHLLASEGTVRPQGPHLCLRSVTAK